MVSYSETGSENGTDQFSEEEVEEMVEAVEGNGSNSDGPLSDEDMLALIKEKKKQVTSAPADQKPQEDGRSFVEREDLDNSYDDKAEEVYTPQTAPSVIKLSPENLFVFSYERGLPEGEVKKVFGSVSSLSESLRRNRGLFASRIGTMKGEENYGIYSKEGRVITLVSRTGDVADFEEDLRGAFERYERFRNSPEAVYKEDLGSGVVSKGIIALNVVVQEELESLTRSLMRSVLDSRPAVYRFELR